MRFIPFRRRQIWLPTIWGWLVLFGIAGATCIIVVHDIYPFLSPNDPTPQARVLVVEGWMTDEELDQAIVAFRTGGYQRIITSGGPVERSLDCRGISSYADWAASYLRAHGLADIDVTPVSAPASAQDRTFLSAVKVRDWVAIQGIELKAFDVFSAGTHARRSRMLYRMAFGPDVEVGVLSARPKEFDQDHWWRTSAGTKSVLAETISVLWTACCFKPPPPGSHEEKWGRY